MLRTLKISSFLISMLFLYAGILRAQSFTEQTAISLPGLTNSSVAWGDYDNDADLDLLLSGYSSTEGTISKIYRNEGSGVFAEQSGITLKGVGPGNVEWGDYNNDGHLDILLTGYNNGHYFTLIYKNNGNNSFSEQTDISMTSVYYSSVDWGDYDNDGNLDILIAGLSSNEGFVSKIYRNYGDNSFIEQSGIPLPGLEDCSVDWGDYDNDGDLDILITGSSAEYPIYNSITSVYKNNGDNSFTEQSDFNLPGIHRASAVWGDYDNDGYLDILLAGTPDSGSGFSRIYHNDQGSGFSLHPLFSLSGIGNNSAQWGDYDNDGDLDILMSESSNSAIYQNTGTNFVAVTDFDLINVNNCDVAWGDYDNDDDLDIIISGYNSGGFITRIYRNNATISNSPPGIPANTQAQVHGNSVALSWEHSSDTETDQAALSYSVQIGTSPTGVDTKSPMADLSTGFRKIVRAGHIQENNWTIQNLDVGTYYWRVQAIDNSYSGSGFSAMGSFTISFTNSIFPTSDQSLIPGSNGDLLSVSESETAGSRQWKYSYSPGGPYDQNITGSTGTTYTPNFSDFGTFYVVCVSESNGTYVISNEVKIEVLQFTEQSQITLERIAYGSLDWGDYDNDGFQDLLLTGELKSRIYRNNGDNTFSEQTQIVLWDARYSDAVWGDHDNDGDLDILLTGWAGENPPNSFIYENNGNNTFSEQTAISLSGVYYSSIAWNDTDQDGDLDIILSGKSASGNQVCTLYRNDKNNKYTQLTPYIMPFSSGELDMGDYDNDGYCDVLMFGTDYSGNKVTKVYKNDGDNTFSDQNDINLRPVIDGSVEWGDFDSDGDLDILLVGSVLNEGYYDKVTLVYENNGDNTFSDQAVVELIGVSKCTASWCDYDNDGDLDIFITGKNDLQGYISWIYENNGNNSFSRNTSLNLPAVLGGAISWADYDNDDDLDLAIGGYSPDGGNLSKIFRNNTLTGNNIPGAPTNLSASVFAGGASLSWNKSVDSETPGDGLSYNICISTMKDSADIVNPMSDLETGFRKISKIGNAYLGNDYTITSLDTGQYYWRVQAIDHSYAGSAFSPIDSFTVLPPFSKIDTDFQGLTLSSAIPGDYDADGDLDILISGDSSYKYSFSQIYRNDKNDLFVNIEAGLTDVRDGSAAWGDYDNDGDLDIVISGTSISYTEGRSTRLYRNNGADSFSEQTDIDLINVVRGTSNWGDLNNDGLQDLFITGSSGNWEARIYKNNGDNTFSYMSGADIEGVSFSSADLGDYDNDMDLDIIISGQASIGGRIPISRVYRNDGNFSFTDINANLINVSSSSSEWGDYDNDGDLDILLAGIESDGNIYTKIYRNEGADSFVDINAFIRGVAGSSLHWGDYDNDGDLDILFSGSSGTRITEIYRNEGGDNFTEIDLGLLLNASGSTAWFDYDNDRDLDILFAGYSSQGNVSTIFRNNINSSNSRPTAPTNLLAENYGYGVKFNWDPSSDDRTPTEALSYNIRIGSSSGAHDIIAPMSDLSSGDLFIQQMGNCQLNSGWYLASLPVGTYYWSVQAVDHTYLGGDWAPEQSFAVTTVNADFSANESCVGIATSFMDLSISSGEPISAWEWDFGDGAVSTMQNPAHAYALSGSYDVKLIASSSQSSDTVLHNVAVKPGPVAGFATNIVCQGSPTNITNQTMLNGTTIQSWSWDFGDEATSATQDPGSHGYLTAGDYTVALTAVADNGCYSTHSKTVTVGTIPVPSITSNDVPLFCDGDTVILSTARFEDYTYQWRKEGTDLTGADSSSFFPRSSGDFRVAVNNPVGNCTVVSDPIAVSIQSAPAKPTISYTGSLEFCDSDSLVLSVTQHLEYTYEWLKYNDLLGSNSEMLTVKTNGKYTIKVSTSAGCDVTSDEVEVTVHQGPPPPSLVYSSPVLCEGQTLTVNISEPGSDNYQWMNALGAIEGETGTSIIIGTDGQYRARVTSGNMCESFSQVIDVQVNPYPDIPVIVTDNYEEGACPTEEVIVLSVETVEPGSLYQWKKGINEIIGADESSYSGFLDEGEYSVVANLEGCTTESLVKKLSYGDMPDKPSIHVSGPVVWYLACSNDSATAYRWYLNQQRISGAENYLYVAGSQEGIFEVAISMNSACFAFSDPVQIPLGTGMNQDIWENLKIYPNPTPGLFTLEMNNHLMGDLIIDIFNESGGQIINIKFLKETSHFKTEIDLSAQPPSLYLINLLLEQNRISRTLIVE